MNNRVRASAREQLETSRRVFEEILTTRAEGLVNAASLVAELGVFYQPLEDTDPTRLEYACQRINQLVGSEVVIVTDRMGVILARTDRRWEVGETFRSTTAVARALRGERASTMWVQDGQALCDGLGAGASRDGSRGYAFGGLSRRRELRAPTGASLGSRRRVSRRLRHRGVFADARSRGDPCGAIARLRNSGRPRGLWKRRSRQRDPRHRRQSLPRT